MLSTSQRAEPDPAPAAGRAPRRRQLVLAAVALAGCAAATLAVLLARTGWVAVGAWLVGATCALAAFAADWTSEIRGWRPTRRTLAVVALCCLPVGVRLALAGVRPVHGDELLIGYFSLREDVSAKRFFAEVPQWRGDFIAQFPTPFFVGQRAALGVLGDSLVALRASVMPYVFLAALFLFLTVRKVIDALAASLAVVLYSFLAIALYLETLGIHSISSTACFLACFWFALRASEHGRRADAVAAGSLCGLCFLLYTSSYVALPVLGVFAVMRIVKTRKAGLVQNAALPALGFATVTAPFFAYALKFNNYFLARIHQVSLLTGDWSDAPERIRHGASAAGIVLENLLLALRAFYRRGIGGNGGYFFGQLALFDTFTLALVTAGLALALASVRRRPVLGVVVVVLAVTFMTGVVLTVPPPAYHRFTLAFPFIALLAALPLWRVWKSGFATPAVRTALALGAAVVFTSTNLDYFATAAGGDPGQEELRVASYINRRFPARAVYVAAFPGNAFERLAYFADPRRPGRMVTNYHSDLLDGFRRDEKYLYVIAMPDDFGAKFHAKDPASRFVRFTTGWGLLFN